MRTYQNVCLLGATGSIGASTLNVLALHPEQYRIFALTGFSRLAELASLTQAHQPQIVVVPVGQGEAFAKHLHHLDVDAMPDILEGEAGLCAVAQHADVDVVMAAIVGAAGLAPTLAAVQAGKRVLLANKEALVMAGELFMQAVRQSGAVLLPVDSEHNAIFQCLPTDYFTSTERFGLQGQRAGVSQILLTASGGPFRTWTADQMSVVTPAQACKHPNWSMGRKISVDSATLMNKGLELIEACHLFDLPEDRITVVVHPESIIHSLVQYVDGSTLAQLGNPDMCTPIAHALAWPQRIDAGVAPLDLFQIGSLHFEAPDMQRFPCLQLARQAMQVGGTQPAVLNAANEVAVEAFLAGHIGFNHIASLIEAVITQLPMRHVHDLATILDHDAEARQIANQWLAARA
jgi:1-deoxy-D-xylulose-5-phosphate reductoisomerase